MTKTPRRREPTKLDAQKIPKLDELPKFEVNYATATEDFLPFGRDEKLVRPWAIPGTPGLEHRLDRRVAAAQRITDNNIVRHRIELRRIVALNNVDAKIVELRAHGWIHVGIAAGNAVSRSTSERRYATHECSANAQNVNVHFS